MKTETTFRQTYGNGANTAKYDRDKMIQENEIQEIDVATQRMIDREMGDAADINLQF